MQFDRLVFVCCVVTALITGLARFATSATAAPLWMDIVFLGSAGVVLAVSVVFLGARLRSSWTRLYDGDVVDSVRRNAAGGAHAHTDAARGYVLSDDSSEDHDGVTDKDEASDGDRRSDDRRQQS